MSKVDKKKKEEENRKRKLFILILMIVFTGVILTASTYAWFTANQTVTVEDIEVNVAASNGLQLSADAVTWKPFISKDDIITGYAGATNQVPNTMVPVSTVGEANGDTGFMNMYRGEIVTGQDGDNILTSTKSLETNTTSSGDFVAFDLFFQITEAKEIYLTSSSAVTSQDGKGIENSARVAFVIEGNGPNGTDATTLRGYHAASSVTLWEPNNNGHTAAAIAHANDVYKKTITDGSTDTAMYGVKDEFDSDANIKLDSQDPQHFTLVTPALQSDKDGIPTTAYLNCFRLEAGITKVRVYMWIEGQDVDCENDASGSDLTYSLQFSILDKQ